MKRKLLLVEDDKELNETIYDFLTLSGYEVVSAFNGNEAIEKVYENSFDLILLDVKLPLQDGFSVAKEIRKNSNIPIIFITSLDSQSDIEKGFLSGGDDYIKKPFSLKELKLRIEAIIRRLYGNSSKIKLKEGFVFDVETLELFRDGEKIHLKKKVAQLLNLFLQNRGKIVSKEEIFNKLYDYSQTPNEASLRTFIANLRTIFGSDAIETIKDVGYKFVG